MRWTTLFFLLLFASLCHAGPRRWVCVDGSCRMMPNVEPDTYEWKVNDLYPEQVDLFRNGRGVGSYSITQDVYYPFSGTAWAAPTIPPVEVLIHFKAPRTEQGEMNFGVDPEGLDHRETYSINGQSVTRGQALKAVATSPCNQLVDDSTLRHLTAIGKDAETAKRLRATFCGPGCTPKLKDFRVQVYDVSRRVDRIMCEPFLLDKDARFQEFGAVVYVQKPEQAGKGAVQLALYGVPSIDAVLEGLRMVDPSFDPQRNPPAKPKPSPVQPDAGPASSSSANIAPLLFAGALAVGAGLYRRV